MTATQILAYVAIALSIVAVGCSVYSVVVVLSIRRRLHQAYGSSTRTREMARRAVEVARASASASSPR